MQRETTHSQGLKPQEEVAESRRSSSPTRGLWRARGAEGSSEPRPPRTTARARAAAPGAASSGNTGGSLSCPFLRLPLAPWLLCEGERHSLAPRCSAFSSAQQLHQLLLGLSSKSWPAHPEPARTTEDPAPRPQRPSARTDVVAAAMGTLAAASGGKGTPPWESC